MGAGNALQVSVPSRGNKDCCQGRLRGPQTSQAPGIQGVSMNRGVQLYDQKTLNHLQVLNQRNIDPETSGIDHMFNRS